MFRKECVGLSVDLGRRPVGLLLRGRPGDFTVVEFAARLTSERNVERGLMVLLARPYVPMGAVLQAGYLPDRYTLDLDLEARARAIQMLEEADLQTKFSLFNISRPALRRGARLAAQLGCEALLVSTRGRLRDGLCGAYERRFGLSMLRVAPDQHPADAAVLSSLRKREDRCAGRSPSRSISSPRS
jgi:hypothetical protein